MKDTENKNQESEENKEHRLEEPMNRLPVQFIPQLFEISHSNLKLYITTPKLKLISNLLLLTLVDRFIPSKNCTANLLWI